MVANTKEGNVNLSGTHLMLDFETLGQRPTSAVLSLGAVIFTQKELLKTAEWFFNPDEQLKRGRTIDYSTIQWWMTQKDEARAIFKSEARAITTLDAFGVEFVKFLESRKVNPWGCGADFDLPIFDDIWRRSIRHASATPPEVWKFWDVRCYRTLKALTGCDKLAVRKGVHHSALDDAIHQAECVIALANKPR
mgnify:FL=1